MRYYISDLHFFHSSLNHQMDNRGFNSAEEMNEYIVNKWNQKVRPNDDVYILGDVSIGNGDQTNQIVSRLNGKKYLIVGNHDKFLDNKKFDTTLFKQIEYYKELRDNRRKVVLSHYPVFCYNGQNRLDDDGQPKAYMLYGHVHNSFDEILVNRFINQTRMERRLNYVGAEPKPIPCNMINCFCMFSDYTPLTLDEWIEVDRKRREELTMIDENGGNKNE